MTFGKRIIIVLSLFLFIACSNKESRLIGYGRTTYTFYTDNETDVCSFNGTNYLIEKGNKEELFSSTAPIEIIKQSKFDNNGKETECEANYYRGSN